MVAIVLCIACKHGHHEGHVATKPAPPGVLGGFHCPCKGGCVATYTNLSGQIVADGDVFTPLVFVDWPPSSRD